MVDDVLVVFEVRIDSAEQLLIVRFRRCEFYCKTITPDAVCIVSRINTYSSIRVIEQIISRFLVEVITLV
jgi:hypothetical protein